jgi:Holliday junction resolvase
MNVKDSMLHGRRDSTHKEIREELRALGASVVDTGDVGHDFPDFVVGFAGSTFLVEAKSAKGEASEGQETFAQSWRGSPVVLLRSRVEAREWLIRTRHALAGRNVPKQLQACKHRVGT